jgi:hypothetical protein
MNDSPQAYTLAFEQRPDYLYATVTAGQITREQYLQYLKEVADKCRELNATRLLVERHILTNLTNTVAFSTVATMADYAPKGLRAAVVETDSTFRQRLEFGVRAAKAEKLEIEVFTTIAEAEEWLLADG